MIYQNTELARDVFKYIGNVSVYRSVSKHFVPKSYVSYVKFLPTACYTKTYSYIFFDEYCSLSTIEFEDTGFLTVQLLNQIVYYKTSVTKVIVNGCDNVLKLPMTPLHTQETRNMENWSIRVTDGNARKISLVFVGCWQLFKEPLPFMTPVDVTELMKNAVINGSGVALKTASNFFEYRMGSFTTGYNFLKELYEHKKKWIITKCIEKNRRAGVIIKLQSTSATESVIVCMLKRKDSCWRIRKIYEMSSECSALHMITMKVCK